MSLPGTENAVMLFVQGGDIAFGELSSSAVDLSSAEKKGYGLRNWDIKFFVSDVQCSISRATKGCGAVCLKYI